MSMKKTEHIGFADLMTQRRKIKSQFFNQMDLLLDWRPISNIINKHYIKGESAVGAPSYPGLMLFKMALLQTWYGLSDYEVEDRLNDSISFSRFVGLSIDDPSPDHSVLSRFRTELTKKNVYEKLFKEFNKQLIKHNIIIKSGAIVDASVVESPLKPKGKPSYEVVQDREDEDMQTDQENQQKEEKSIEVIKKTQPGVDTEASWIKKSGKLKYGYKKHVVSDNEGMVLGVVTTTAKVNEISNLEEVLKDVELPKNIPFYADKGYASKKNRDLMKSKNLKDRILKRAVKGKPLSDREKLFNKIIGKTRYKIERVFGSIKRWFNGGQARYKGMMKMHTQNLMEAIAYNLYRSPGIIMSNREK